MGQNTAIAQPPETDAAAPTGRRSPVRRTDQEGQADEPAHTQPPAQNQAQAPRAKGKFGIRKTFGIDIGFEEDPKTGKPMLDGKGNKIPREREVTGFAEKTPWVPDIDPAYVFPADETKVLLLGLELKDRILLVGETGTGKTTLLEQVAARLNYNFVRINFDGAITRQDLIGEWVVKGRQMVFQYGVLVHAFQMPGTIICLDEWDSISGECAFVLQRPLEKGGGGGKLLVMETGGELIPLAEDNVLAATANTVGQGDDTGLYTHGTKVQNYAQINRFSLTIRMNYLPAEKEEEMIRNRHPELNPAESKALVKAINMVREAYTNSELSAPLSPRDLINWADKYIRMGDPLRAAKFCFLNRMPDEDQVTAEGIIKRSFAGTT
jgi:cobaltochelatase CobS